jgi:protein-tyrosine kinase
MSIIEQAAKRLEQLKKSGIQVPDGLTGVEPALGSMGQPAPDLDRGAGCEGLPPPPEAPQGQISRRVEINLGRMREAGMVVPDTPQSKLSDEFRVIKWPLLQNARGGSAAPVERGNLIMVASAVPGEGKSFVAVNLAMSMAMERDTYVLLVDTDVAGRSLPAILGVRPSGPGLLDLLSDPGLDPSEALLRTNVEHLSLLLAGRRHPHATELLASEAMRTLLNEMAYRYSDRVIIFDSPPLLATPEARVLATYMGQIVLVVEADRTTHAMVQRALETLEPCPVVMTVLNKAFESEVGSYYGYRQQFSD